MDGVTISKYSDRINELSFDQPQLLARIGRLEVMQQDMRPKSIIWISPPDDPNVSEGYYIVSGKIELSDFEEQMILLGAGDYFQISGLKHDIKIKPLEQTSVLFFSSAPVYNSLIETSNTIQSLLNHIGTKDINYSLHSKNVMALTCHLYELIGDPKALSHDDLVASALFHDIGKCYIPDEILLKPARLSTSEFRIVQRHCLDSKTILLTEYGPTVADIVYAHHECMDGSGYPLGLAGDDIPLAARIIKVADTFDAMITSRVYKAAVTPKDAVEEMRRSTHYDQTVVNALATMVYTNEYRKYVEMY